MTDRINNNPQGGVSGISGVGDIPNNNMSVQLILAQVEMMLAKDNKAKALRLIDGIKSQQAEAKKMADTINQLRQLQQDIKDKKVSEIPTDPKQLADLAARAVRTPEDAAAIKDAEKCILIYSVCFGLGDLPTTLEGIAEYRKTHGNNDPAINLREWCLKNGVPVENPATRASSQKVKDLIEAKTADPALIRAAKAYLACSEYGLSLKGKPSADDINLLIESMKTKQEQCGTDIQQTMVFVQDYIGQYNAYSQGASSAVSQGNQTLAQLARGQ
ncbi:MAG: hypothetical protein K6A65_04705 [Succinivibrionaceae bacterium]|nr:hypothetical protein [Succinivibrionaceae bacterium]